MSDIDDSFVYAGPDPHRAVVTSDTHYGLSQPDIFPGQVLNIIEAMNDGTLDEVLDSFSLVVDTSDYEKSIDLVEEFREAAKKYLFR